MFMRERFIIEFRNSETFFIFKYHSDILLNLEIRKLGSSCFKFQLIRTTYWTRYSQEVRPDDGDGAERVRAHLEVEDQVLMLLDYECS
jgi:hypothetical protein